jgi:signal transduction histidine kinase
VIIHEVERGVRSIYEAAKSGVSPAIVEKQSRALMSVVESMGGLLRERSKGDVDIRRLVQDAAEISDRRFKRHQISVKYELPKDDAHPFIVKGNSALLQNVLTNLIDNAIYWLRVRWPDQNQPEPPLRRLYIGISDDLEGGRALIVADNGPGFQDDPDILTKPFFTRRPDGSGLGLYYAALAMGLSGGNLIFPTKDDLDLPEWVTGAIIALQFKEPKK